VKKLTVHIVAIAVALAFAASALAGSSLTSTYGGKAAGVQATVKGAVTKTTRPAVKGSTAGTLPFTGLDLTLIVVGGIVLLVAGAGMRRAGRNKA
jgi:hypothetical protein